MTGIVRVALLIAVFALLPTSKADTLDDYVKLATGEFSSAVHAKNDSRYDAITWQITEIWSSDPSGDRWLYTESWMDGSDRPYMQRISRVSLNDDGTLLSTRYRIPEPQEFVSAWQDPERFANLNRNSLIELAGCEAVLVRAGTDRFEGGTRGNQCLNTYKGASYAISQKTLTADGMTNWDRGFSAAGEHVWGPAAGGYRFIRKGADNSCRYPVRMLVYGEITDRKKFGAYARAIAEAGLYPETGGYYEALSPAIAVFEGDPPATRGVVIVRFPCEQAARDFWYSEAYEAIKPLRDGISDFEVLLLPVPPIAKWAP